MKKIVTTVMVMFAIGCGDAEAKAPVTEIQSTPNIVIVPNTKHIDYSAYNREWRKANNLPELRWTRKMQENVNVTAKVTTSQDPEDKHEIVEIELDDLGFKEAFNIELRAKGQGHTFYWRGTEYSTNLLNAAREKGFKLTDPYIERIPKVTIPVEVKDLEEKEEAKETTEE